MSDHPAVRPVAPLDVLTLLLLAALWGASFLFMRVAAPEFGPVPLVALRVALAAAVLLPVMLWVGQGAALRTHVRPMAWVGVINSALPFLGFAWAALSITAGLSSVFNATAPMWGALIGWWWLAERPTVSRGLGLLLGFVGVTALAGETIGLRDGTTAWAAAGAVFACLGATACYGFAAHLTRQRLSDVPVLAVATGSQLAAAAALAVPGLLLWPDQAPSARAWMAAIGLAVPCTALAYLLFFRLIARLGAARAVTVTFLIPLFGTTWGVLWLDEAVTPVLLGAGAVILAGTALATGVIGFSAPTRPVPPPRPTPPDQ